MKKRANIAKLEFVLQKQKLAKLEFPWNKRAKACKTIIRIKKKSKAFQNSNHPEKRGKICKARIRPNTHVWIRQWFEIFVSLESRESCHEILLLCRWYPRGLIVHQQKYRPSHSNKNVDIKFNAHDAFLVRSNRNIGKPNNLMFCE
jgi:hypothetical protein